MFKNFKFNLDALISLLISSIILLIFEGVCIQYGISRFDRLLAFLSIFFSQVFYKKAFDKFFQKT